MTHEILKDLFTYHHPKGNQAEQYQAIRDKAHELAVLMFETAPESPDTTAAIRKLRESVFTINASIAIYS